jgi:glycosyltransferase involved in cell wall biosynthesis
MRNAMREDLGIREPHVILNVKRLHELAGQKYLIDAFARIAQHRRDVRLVICGTGALRDTLESQARTERVGHATTFTGLVPNEDVARYAAVADVFALPSLLEALPTVAVEALACGTPVVSADHPGGVELHKIFGDDVIVVPREDAAALAHAIDTHIRAPRRTRPETAALLKERFSPASVLAAFDSVYKRSSRRAE